MFVKNRPRIPARKEIMSNGNIDIVLPWVDGSDPSWQAEKNEWLLKNPGISAGIDPNANSNCRYESWDNLQYIFRGIEKFMPWVHKVFLVTNGQVPAFLNTDHPKLRLITHESYIPEEYLPTFNSGTIEMNYFRISDLSENFILFNDDFFPLSPISEEYYFQDDCVCDEAVESPVMPVGIGEITEYSLMLKMNDVLFINRHFDKREVQKKNPSIWFNDCYGELLQRTEGLSYWNHFVGFHDRHMPAALKKSTMRKVWEVEPERLDLASRNHFRAYTDLNHWLVRYWQFCEGKIVPRKTLGEPYLVTLKNCKEVADQIRNQKHQMICLSEDCKPEEFPIIRDTVNHALEDLLPEKSSFEL